MFCCPLLAHADALDGAFFILQLLTAVWGLALLGMVFSVLAYLRPRSRSLEISNYVVNGFCLFLGLAWLLVFSQGSGGSTSQLGEMNPYLRMTVPFAVWLWAANKVAYRSQPSASTWWVATAVVAATLALNTLLFGLMRWLLAGSLHAVYGGTIWPWLLSPAIVFGIWWLVLRQVQRVQPLRWPARAVWLVPAQALLLSTACGYLPLLPVLSQLVWDLNWLTQSLRHGLLSFGVGAVAIWLNQRRHQLAPEAPA